MHLRFKTESFDQQRFTLKMRPSRDFCSGFSQQTSFATYFIGKGQCQPLIRVNNRKEFSLRFAFLSYLSPGSMNQQFTGKYQPS